MCAHYTYNRNEAKFRLREKVVVFGTVPRASIRPTDLAPVIIPEFEGMACRELRWGWKVPWDKKPFINAKSETVTQLATFKPHLQNRCLILADGFYEKGIRFIQPGEPVFALAGLWADDPHPNRNLLSASIPFSASDGEKVAKPDEVSSESGEKVAAGRMRGDGEETLSTARISGEVSKQMARSFVMLTTTPNDSVAPHHHRMPFILRAEQYTDWLGDNWQRVLANPDKAALEKIRKQAELF